MLRHIEDAKAKIGLALIAISTTVAVVLDHALASPFKRWSSYLAVGIVSMAAWCFQFGMEALMNRSRRIRKVIAGDDYVEGTWIEVYRSRESIENHYGVIRIGFADGALFVSGETYNGPETCSERGSWRSKASHYEEGVLVYFYEESVEGEDVAGSGRFDFSMVNGYPLKYQSRIFDPIHTHKVIGLGFKIEDKADLQMIRTGGAQLRTLLRRYGNKIVPHVGR